MAKKAKKNTQARSRKFSLVTYHDEKTIEEVLSKRPVRAAAYITHDRDVNKDGTLKEKHVHIMLCTTNGATLAQVRRWFPETQNTLAQLLGDDEAMEKYLTHEGQTADKAPYPVEAIRTWGEGLECFRRAVKSSSRATETAEDLVNDLLNGVGTRDMVRRYGREFIIHRRAYVETAMIIKTEEQLAKSGAQREWELIQELYDRGVLGEWDYMNFEDIYKGRKEAKTESRAEYNPYMSANEAHEIEWRAKKDEV